MDAIENLKSKQNLAKLGGGAEKQDKIRNSGRLTARDRIEYLLDMGSFIELDEFMTHRSEKFGIGDKKFLGDGVITGTGTINNRPVVVFSQDSTVFGGALADAHAKKIVKVMEHAERIGCPVIGINDSGGARIQEGVESLAGYADIFHRNVRASGVIPQISLIMGACAGGAVYSPAITDFILMVEHSSHMFITGPDVIYAVTKEEIDKETLGGAHTHLATSGVCHLTAKSDQELLELTKKLFSYIPQNNLDPVTINPTNDIANRPSPELNSLIPTNPQLPYDIRDVIFEVSDNKYFFEIQSEFAPNIVIGFSHIDGQSVGIVANQPKALAGCIDINASDKGARFVRFCDAFNIPIVTFVDVPGFLPGIEQEHGGIIRHGAKLLYAYSESTVPKITIITRKAYGGAYDVMASKHIGADFNFSYPNAEIAVMGASGAVQIIYRTELSKLSGDALNKRRKELEDHYKEQFSNPWEAARLGYIDSVIEPQYTREYIAKSLNFLRTKKIQSPKRKHGNIPL